MDLRRALMLQIEWGADEALLAEPQRRLLAPPLPTTLPPPVPLPPPASAAINAPSSLAEFAVALAAADGAGLAATATRLVLPTGTPGGLMILGEAPGAAEDRSGEAFVGPEGQLLRRMLASIDINPATVMLAYLAPWRPPGGRAPSEAELAACLPLLHQLLGLARPTLLLALGSVPARALLGPAMRRGRWNEAIIPDLDLPLAVLPTANPAVLLKQPRQKAAAWAELRALRRRMDEPGSASRQIEDR